MKLKTLAIMAIGTMLATSCVSNKKYSQLQTQYDELQLMYGSTRDDLLGCRSDVRNLETQLDNANALNTELRNDLSDAKKALAMSMKTTSEGNANIAKLVDEINSSNKYIKQLVDAKTKSDSLNLVLTNKLTQSLTTSELKDIDVKVLKGVVYISLSDNMLFKSGSYEVSSQAKETLSKIAKILKDYKSFDVLVEGNTDNVPISKTNIRNNWDLSALRASSIVQMLQNDFGIDPSRLSAAGRGEYNPVTDNDTDLGRQRNRRTEIIITPQLDEFMDLIDQAPTDN